MRRLPGVGGHFDSSVRGATVSVKALPALSGSSAGTGVLAEVLIGALRHSELFDRHPATPTGTGRVVFVRGDWCYPDRVTARATLVETAPSCSRGSWRFAGEAAARTYPAGCCCPGNTTDSRPERPRRSERHSPNQRDRADRVATSSRRLPIPSFSNTAWRCSWRVFAEMWSSWTMEGVDLPCRTSPTTRL